MCRQNGSICWTLDLFSPILKVSSLVYGHCLFHNAIMNIPPYLVLNENNARCEGDVILFTGKEISNPVPVGIIELMVGIRYCRFSLQHESTTPDFNN